MFASTPAARYWPGERLKQTIWLKAICRGDAPPMPTVERVNAIKLLAAAWAQEDGVNEEA